MVLRFILIRVALVIPIFIGITLLAFFMIRLLPGEGRVIGLHALRNALIPVVTVIGLQVGVLFSGAVLTETIFAWPGIGRWLISSIERRDYPTVQGGILLVATVIILVNLVVDVVYGVINPRLRVRR